MPPSKPYKISDLGGNSFEWATQGLDAAVQLLTAASVEDMALMDAVFEEDVDYEQLITGQVFLEKIMLQWLSTTMKLPVKEVQRELALLVTANRHIIADPLGEHRNE